VDQPMEAQRLAHRRQEAGQERRPVAAARCTADAASRALALGARPYRPCPERARGPAGARRARAGALTREREQSRCVGGRLEPETCVDLAGFALKLLEQGVATGYLDLARRFLDLEHLHHAVLDQHGIAFRARAEAVARAVE